MLEKELSSSGFYDIVWLKRKQIPDLMGWHKGALAYSLVAAQFQCYASGGRAWTFFLP